MQKHAKNYFEISKSAILIAIEAAYEWPGQEAPCARSQQSTSSNYNSGILVFPNPAQSKWHIASAWPSDQKIHFQLRSASGQLIIEEDFYSRERNDFLSISNTILPKGVYFLTISSEGIPFKTVLLLK